ncbi:MAG: YjbQ family protein [Alphaproteobacteria bacterium]|nr:secondary thiamine-phosphate synthase enzyme YjbQ [Myxococcales bacterium]MCB9699926.1 YjbQ family protein [Alphaproteobacteria bacterium]
MHRHLLEVRTAGRGLWDITGPIQAQVRTSGLTDGLCHLFCQHTSASLTIQENADPDVLRDLDGWMTRTVRDGDPAFRHRDEGDDDMSAHVRTALTHTSLTVPVMGGRLGLGTWQAVYLFEHRTAPHTRKVVISVV